MELLTRLAKAKYRQPMKLKGFHAVGFIKPPYAYWRPGKGGHANTLDYKVAAISVVILNLSSEVQMSCVSLQ